MKLAVRLGLLTTLFLGACHCPKAHEGAEPGRWQLVQSQPHGYWMLTDTATGRVWLGSQTTERTKPSDPYKFVWWDLEAPVATK